MIRTRVFQIDAYVSKFPIKYVTGNISSRVYDDFFIRENKSLVLYRGIV
jgi:hypothetical protein